MSLQQGKVTKKAVNPALTRFSGVYSHGTGRDHQAGKVAPGKIADLTDPRALQQLGLGRGTGDQAAKRRERKWVSRKGFLKVD